MTLHSIYLRACIDTRTDDPVGTLHMMSAALAAYRPTKGTSHLAIYRPSPPTLHDTGAQPLPPVRIGSITCHYQDP